MTRDLGDKLGPKISRLVADTIVATKKGLLPTEHKLRVKATQDIIDRAGRETAALYRPLVEAGIEQHPGDMHPEVEAFLRSAASGEHQWQALAGLTTGGVANAFGNVISNALAPIAYHITSLGPNLDIDPATAAAAAAAGIVTYGDAASSARQQGFSSGPFETLYRLAQRPPDLSTLQELVNRGEMPEGDAEAWLRRQGYADTVRARVMGLRKAILAPADAALAVLRGNMSEAEGRAVAKANGVDNADFDILIGNTGEPPGVMDLLTAFRRGFIDQAQLEHGIRQSRVRNEWIPTVLKLRFQPMTTADAIDATVQNHLPVAEARAIAEQNGLEPSAFNPLLQTAGSPLSKTEMLRLHRMGKVTTVEVEQALRESRLKDKYIHHALELTTQIPPLFSIRHMLTSGAIDDAQAATLLREDGYQDFVIKAILKSAKKVKVARVHTITEGMLSELYQEHAITGTQFIDHLKVMGYSQAEAEEIREVDDWRIAKTNRDNAINRVRAGYLGRKISEQTASAELDRLLVPAPMRDRLLADWDIAIESEVRLLTPAQIVAAWSFQLLDTAQALGKLTHLGYSAADARLMLEIKNKGPLQAGQ